MNAEPMPPTYEEACEEITRLRSDIDRIRGRDDGHASRRDYWFAERIFAGWRERAERGEEILRQIVTESCDDPTPHSSASLVTRSAMERARVAVLGSHK
jgi:hypothetical protein